MRDSRAGYRMRGTVVAASLGILFFGSSQASGEIIASIYGGVALTQDDDLRLQQSGGTDLTFHGVSYRGRDFASPPYYGGRLAYFPGERSHWGFGAEFFHAKMYLETGKTVHVIGTRAGAPVDAAERIDNTIESFNISHGLNFLMAEAIYRWFPAERGKEFLGRFQPYIGAGIGAVIPHVETTIGGLHFEQYEWRGPGVQGFAGTNFDLLKHLSLFVEYKFTYANLDKLDIPGGSIEIMPLSHHFVGGISISF